MSQSGLTSTGRSRHNGDRFVGKMKSAVRSKGGKRPDLGNMFFRSSWEANYARYLNLLVQNKEIKSWQYEADTFDFPIKRGTTHYTPDFKIFENDGSFYYVEVKGWMDAQSKTKLKRMAKYYPQYDLKIVMIKEMRAIYKATKDIIKWEGKIK